jgi:AcrR family transcriptional regulator
MSSAEAPSHDATARTRLLITAERLIGERGVEVSLREIAAAAGQRNNSAVHYYFGGRDSLIEAIVDLRQQPLEAQRLEWYADLDAHDRDDIHALVTVLINPMFETPYAAGATHYARFLEKIRDHPTFSSAAFQNQHWPATRMLVGRIAQSMDDFPPDVVETRLRSMMTSMFALLADAERTLETSGRTPAATDASGVVDMMVGLLTAPQSQ